MAVVNTQNNVLILEIVLTVAAFQALFESCGNAWMQTVRAFNDFIDNCLNVPNTNQLDCNDNGIGDAYEQLDTDCDGIFDLNDNA
ncbi:MAG: hypothetical protein IPP37_15040 [Saprospiraceae bacterium]|nr:hypothetical protein [Saprospiraceae bacterium]